MDQIKAKLKDLSLKKSLSFIVFVMIILVAVLSAISIWWCMSVQQQISQSRDIVIHDYDVVDKTNGSLSIQPKNYEYKDLTMKQNVIYTLFKIGAVMLPIFIVTIGVLYSASLFYRLKLKHPIFILEQSAIKIAENNLDFSIDYNNRDEMGQLCNAFEKMRRELYQNNQTMWKMMNERRQFYTSVNHDLRTPITVVKGYTEYLQRNIPKGKITDEKLQGTLKNIMESISRLEKYVESVHGIQVMEEMELQLEAISLPVFIQEVKDSMSIISVQKKKVLTFSCDIKERNIVFDKQILFRILENIIGNAVRYANKEVKVICFKKEEQLFFDIIDDGMGFTQEDLKSACCPFYTDKKETGHLGIGLATCKILCKRHGGGLMLSNKKDGGAKVSFYISVK